MLINGGQSPRKAFVSDADDKAVGLICRESSYDMSVRLGAGLLSDQLPNFSTDIPAQDQHTQARSVASLGPRAFSKAVLNSKWHVLHVKSVTPSPVLSFN